MRPASKRLGAGYLSALLLMGGLMAATGGHAQNSARTGEIDGVVKGPNGSGVAGAQVVLQSSISGQEGTRTTSDGVGRFSFASVPFGAYKVRASAAGFGDSVAKLVMLTSAKADAELVLKPAGPAGGDAKVSGAAGPAFTAAGALGSTAPSGYSTGLGSEEAAQARVSVGGVDAGLIGVADQSVPVDCRQQPVLLRKVADAPHDFAANHALGSFYLSHGEYEKALPYLTEAHSVSPGNAANVLDLAGAMIGAGRGADAAVLLKPTLAEHASDAGLLRLLAVAYWSSGDKDNALAMFQRAANLDSGIDNQYACGVGLIELGAVRAADEVFVSATRKHPDSARLWLGLGLAEELSDRKQEAVTALLRSANTDAGFLRPLTVLAGLSGLSGETKDVLRRRIDEYLAGHPADADAHYAIALYLIRQTQPGSSADREGIVSHLQRAVQLNPRLARAHFLLGEIYADAGNLGEATSQFVDAAKLEPGDAQAHYRLSLLYRRSGRQDLARTEMDTFLMLSGKSEPGDSASRSAIRQERMPVFTAVSNEQQCEEK